MSEFSIIRDYFAAERLKRPDVIAGIGDDAAIVTPKPGHELAITTDTLIAGVHFPTTTPPYDVGYKSLAVNLSDLAAMGATPAWVTLALTLPHAEPEWLRGFCEGFFALANKHQVELIGGDLTKGPLSITVQAIGFTKPKQAILRSSAKPGDLIYVTGTIGDAALALHYLQEKISLPENIQRQILARLNRPEPRVDAGKELCSLATAAIDISDGLAADLGHILEQSDVGAIIYVDQLPISQALIQTLTLEDAIELALTGGDDYELCFTISEENKSQIEQQLSAIHCRLSCIGEITKKKGLALLYKNGSEYHGKTIGYQHF